MKPSIEIPDVPNAWRDSESAATPEVGEYYLPGLGKTYLNPEFADKVADFVQKSSDRGISLKFDSGYRTQVKQDALRVDPTATTPAHHSLHSAGRGVDVGNWTALGPDAQNRVVSAAKDAGLNWGGQLSPR